MHYRIFLIVIPVLFVLSAVSFAQTAYVNAERGVNMRSGAGTDHTIITSIPNQSRVTVLNKRGDWWQVEYNGQRGYIRSAFLTEETSRASASAQRQQPQQTRSQSSVQRTYSGSPGYSSPYHWGIGFRIGDPSGLTVKRYLGGNALELSIGQTYFWYEGYGYRNRFDDWYRERNFAYADHQYLGYTSRSHIGIQLHYLFQNEIGRLGDASLRGLFWYYGFGGQLRHHQYAFDYRYRLPGSPVWYYANSGRVTDIDLGVNGTIGLEYTFNNAPIAVFLDSTLFMEIIGDPFALWFHFGLGARYNF